MTEPAPASDAAYEEIDLKNPALAAFLAWLFPGLGHWYQGRRSKAVLFFVCIFGTFSYGLYLGEGRVVYAAWRPEDKRLPYLCQVCVGLPALPALVQARRFDTDQKRLEAERRVASGKDSFFDTFMVPPQVYSGGGQQRDEDVDQLDRLQKRLHRRFELGTVFTMVAGLLNILIIYDAWGGPAYSERIETRRRKEEEADKG